MNQKQQVMEYIRRYGSITTLQAIDDLGILRLGARISELRKQGYNIAATVEKGKNRNGEETRYHRYFLADKKRA